MGLFDFITGAKTTKDSRRVGIPAHHNATRG